MVGNSAVPTSGTDAVPSARYEPYIVANPFGVSDSERPSAELTMLSGVKVGDPAFSFSAPKQDRKRSAASSRYAAVINRFYHAGETRVYRRLRRESDGSPGCTRSTPRTVRNPSRWE